MQAQTSKQFFGGALLEGRRKHLRPLSVKNSLHFVLRSRWASGKDSFLAARNRKVIDNIITHFAKKFAVKIYERALNSNHFHLLLRITNRPLYRAFIKVVSGKVASQGLWASKALSSLVNQDSPALVNQDGPKDRPVALNLIQKYQRRAMGCKPQKKVKAAKQAKAFGSLGRFQEF